MSDKRVLRWRVPLDDKWHRIGAGEVALVSWRPIVVRAVEVWTIEYLPPGWPDTNVETKTREVRVYGTGQEIEHDSTFIGSTLSHDGNFVWHLFERPDQGADR